MQRRRVLAEPDAAIAAKLKSNPGKVYVIAGGPLSNRGTYSTVAWRINNGIQAAFRPAGQFKASVSSDANEPGRIEPAELRCFCVPNESVESY